MCARVQDWYGMFGFYGSIHSGGVSWRQRECLFWRMDWEKCYVFWINITHTFLAPIVQDTCFLFTSTAFSRLLSLVPPLLLRGHFSLFFPVTTPFFILFIPFLFFPLFSPFYLSVTREGVVVMWFIRTWWVGSRVKTD